MGKKVKVDINGKPLEAITIGQIKKSKYGWIGTIILFVLFISIIYFLPELSKYYQIWVEGKTDFVNNAPANNTVVIPEEDSSSENTEDSQTDASLFLLSTETNIKYKDLLFSNFVYQNNTISFTVKNEGGETISLEENQLYLQTYNTNTLEKNMLNTIELSAMIMSGQQITLSYETAKVPVYLNVLPILEEDYTYIVLDSDENNLAKLTCENDIETIEYIFINDKLREINQKVSILKSAENYDSIYDKYHTILVKYATQNGIEINLSTNTERMEFTLKLDYTIFSNNIENDYYFAKDTSSRIINFKMESKLFECK